MSHALLSPSSSDRWLTCPGSVRLAEVLNLVQVKDNGSSAAQEGTAAHALAEILLTKPHTIATDFIGSELEGVEVTVEMVDHVQGYVEYCRNLGKGFVAVEERVNYSRYVQDGYGTADYIHIGGGVLNVVDLKYGAGVKVEVKENTQAMLYALGAIADFGWVEDIHTVVLHIYQPRKDNISWWTTSLEDLHKFGRRASDMAWVALECNPLENLVVSEKGCKWCKHVAHCPAQLEHTRETIDPLFPNLDYAPEVGVFPQVVAAAPMIRKWLDAVEAEVLRELGTGAKYDEVKLVTGRSTTKLTEEGQKHVVADLGEDAYDKKLIGITKLKKLYGAKRYAAEVEPLTEKVDGKLKVVPRSAPGKEVNTITFEDLS